jgi:inorganic pyrophosphatase
MPNLLTIPHRLDEQALTCRAIIETPRGCRSKYDYDPDTGLFALAGLLPAGMAFPLAFGFVPDTLGEDGDPLDVLVVADEDLPLGCLITIRLLGVIDAEQTEQGETKRNDRLVGKVAQSRSFADIEQLAQLGEGFIEELKRFFVTYNALKDNSFAVLNIGDAAAARDRIREGSKQTASARGTQ